MAYYRCCENCGANLDPGERCDCQNKETAPGIANTESCKVDGKWAYSIHLHNTRESVKNQGGTKKMSNPFNNQGMRCVGEVSHPQVNDGRPLPLFDPVSSKDRPSINTMEGWNAAAEKANSRAFFQVFGRYPTGPEELRSWVDSHFSKNFARSVRK